MGNQIQIRLQSSELAPAQPVGAAAQEPFWAQRVPGLSPANQNADCALGLRALGWYGRNGKRVADVALVLVSAPLWLPLMLVCALALWLEGGNPFYRQDRLGRGGETFRIWKLRTMVRDADTLLAQVLADDPAKRAEWDRTQKLREDPRITRVGAWLRATSLDELPQLFNVLKGEMSLVGPRPMMPDQLPMYPRPAPYFALRPGLTGLWQVSARNSRGFAFRSEADARYLADLSAGRDLGLIWRTLGVVLRRTGC